MQKRFLPKEDGSFVGYGVATKGISHPPVEFDCCDTYIQKEGIVKDFGVYDDPDSLLIEHGQNMSAFKRFLYANFGRYLMNKNVRRIRKQIGFR